MKMPSKVPKALAGSLAALVMLAAGVSIQNAEPTPEALHNEYIRAVAADTSTSMAVKIAMVMGSQYESSGKHIGKPYVDKDDELARCVFCLRLSPCIRGPR